MRFCTFTLRGERPDAQRAGVVRDHRVFELEPRVGMAALVASHSWQDARSTGDGYPLAEVSLFAPLQRPGKIVATIVNTRAMLGGDDVDLDRPRLDMKAPSTVIGPGASILVPPGGVRPEIELAAIMGDYLTGASVAEARSAIFGFTIMNDMTAPSDSREDAYEAYRRDRSTGIVRKSTMRGPLFRSKNHDTFSPMGPWAVTADELDASDLRLTTRFDGDMVQEGSTADYLFTPADLAAYVSGFLTLEPGDVISSGSVGWTKGALGDRDPTEYVLPEKNGILELEIEDIGRLVNPVSLIKTP